jgi:hypothetical protein
MQLNKPSSRPASGGYALIITLAFLTVALMSYASLMYWISSNANITKRNNLFNQAEGAAESATELAMATMMRDFNSQSLNAAATYSSSTNLPSQSGWPVTYQYSNTNGVTNATSVYIGPTNWSSLPSQYTNLYGLGQYCEVASQATPLNQGANLSAIVDQTFWVGSIPLFQFAIFYNMDLEINPGAAMNINGRVHSNNNIYATGSGSGTSALTFSSIVDASQQFYSTPDPLDTQNYGNRSGNLSFTDTNNGVYPNPNSDVSSFSLPIGTNNNPATVMGLLGIPPAGTAAASPTGQAYLYNDADLIVSNSAGGTLSVYYQNLNNASPQTLVPMDVTNIVSHTTNLYYSFVTNVAFYDYRESDNVKAVQLDVQKLNTWLKNNTNALNYQIQNNTQGSSTSKGHNINGVYVYNSIPPASGSPGVLPAVRVVNGQQLPSAGLTVATPFPIYVKGNFNTTTNGTTFSTALGDVANTLPAALMGDAITVLSANWSDTNTSTTAIGSRTPANTTINAACLEGIVPSNGTNYSGGVENFLRLLENWSSSTTTLSYNGSIVVLFTSQYASSPWVGTGTVYNPPARAWGFDVNFLQQGGLPPMTPQVRATVRSGWSAR